MHHTERQQSGQSKRKPNLFTSTPMNWLIVASQPDFADKFPFLLVPLEDVRKAKHAAVTLAAMRFIVRNSERYFAGVERLCLLTGLCPKTIQNHWKTLVELKLLLHRPTGKKSTEFRIAPVSDGPSIVIPLGMIELLDTFAEQVLMGIVLSSTWKLMSSEDKDLGHSISCLGHAAYLSVGGAKWKSLTGMHERQLFRAKQSLEEKKKITVHGQSRRYMLPYGSHPEWDDIRNSLDLMP
ncbi:hypothetical protein SH449x_001729 [Pirellulaceae bacterium SH449]